MVEIAARFLQLIWEPGEDINQDARVTVKHTYAALEIRSATRSAPLIASSFLVTAEKPLINTLHTLSIFDPVQIPMSRVCSSHSC